jgi:hypothetical protein
MDFSPESLTFLSLRHWLVCEAGLIELSPLEVLLVASTYDIPRMALPACWFVLIAFEPFDLASDATWRCNIRSVNYPI